jgi:hypothetical protein
MSAVRTESLMVDHVVIGVPDLDDAAATLLVRYGLIAAPGGRHPRFGTANRIVPLGTSYLELVAVDDAYAAATHPFGTWVIEMAARRAAWGWALRSTDIEVTAARLGLDVTRGERVRADGVHLSWRLAGVPAEQGDYGRPFFIQWDDATPLPGEADVPHPAGQASLAELHVSGQGLGPWLDGPVPQVVLGAGLGGVESIVLTTGTGISTITNPL